MNQLNSIILEGNVARKAELSEPTTGFIVCKFPLAVNRKSKSPEGEQKEEVSFFDIETYGKIAETCAKFCDKGKGIRVVGRLKQSRWEDNNQKHSRVYVIAEHVEYKFSKSSAPQAAANTNTEKSEDVKKAEEVVDTVVSAPSATQPQTEEAAVF